jgi:hypothetical protein
MPAKPVRRKPATVEAFQFDGTLGNARDILNWGGEASEFRAVISAGTRRPFIEVPVESGGVVTAGPSDWIVRTESGRYRVLSDEKFLEEYEDAPPVTP